MRVVGFLAVSFLAGCATNQGGLLNQPIEQTFTSPKQAGVVAGCVQQSLNGGPTMGTDGTNYWVTRQSAFGPAVRYDFKPAASGHGTTVEYRSKIKVNNGVDKVKSCL